MPHGQEQVISGRKVKLSPVMVYSAALPYQGGGDGGTEGRPLRGPATASKLPILKTKCYGATNLHIPLSKAHFGSRLLAFLSSSSSLFLFLSLKSAKTSINLWSLGILLVLPKELLKWREIYGWQFVTINQDMLINKVGQLFSRNPGRLQRRVRLIILFIIFD